MRPLAVLAVCACWFGAALLFAAAVAPVAFAALPSRALAGLLVGRLLPVLFVSGLLCAAATIALGLGQPRVSSAPARLGLACAWAGACAVAQWWVMPRIEQVRATIAAPVDTLAADDPRRLAFGRLHGVSVGLLGLAMVAALVLAILSAIAARPQRV